MNSDRAGSQRPHAHAPLGVFDSGVGGLTVARALRRVLPNERIIYLGDTARVPYGTRAPATVVRYAIGCVRHLVGRGVKAVVIACNTVSAVAPERLRVEFDLPILSVIEPGARAAVAATRSNRIGVLATPGTTASGAYPRAILALSTRAEVFSNAAPLLVPLCEEGWTVGDVPRLAVQRYLWPLASAAVDVVVLGCTHYPLLLPILEAEAHALISSEVCVLDSAEVMAVETKVFLEARGLARPAASGPGDIRVLATDLPRDFWKIAEAFLGEAVSDVEQVDL